MQKLTRVEVQDSSRLCRFVQASSDALLGGVEVVGRADMWGGVGRDATLRDVRRNRGRAESCKPITLIVSTLRLEARLGSRAAREIGQTLEREVVALRLVRVE